MASLGDREVITLLTSCPDENIFGVWLVPMLLFSFFSLWLVASVATLPVGPVDVMDVIDVWEATSDWPPRGGGSECRCRYSFTDIELAEVKEYFVRRLNLTLPASLVCVPVDVNRAIKKAYERVIEDRYFLGILFYHDYLNDFVSVVNGFVQAWAESNTEVMRFLAARYCGSLAYFRNIVLSNFSWEDTEMPDGEIIQTLKFFSAEILPLIQRPRGSWETNPYSDTEDDSNDECNWDAEDYSEAENDSEAKDEPYSESYEASHMTVPPWSPGNAHDFTVGELRMLVCKSLRGKRFAVTRWLLDAYTCSGYVGWFVYPFRGIKERGGPMTGFRRERFALANNLEPRPLFRELISLCDQKAIANLHHVLTHRLCPEEVKVKMCELIRGEDEFTEMINSTFSGSDMGREILQLVRE